MSRLLRLLGLGSAPQRRMLDGFVDSLLQTFENCRPGLSEQTIIAGKTQFFFEDLYEKEVPRLREQIRRTQTHLSDAEREDLFRRVDDRIRRVVLPGYERLTGPFTRRERNDFYLAPDALHGAERLGFAALGLLLGAFVVWAPFIPLWSKEWVLVFGVGGLLFPSLRRVFALRRYQGELDQLVTRTDDEIWRMDLNLITAAAVREGATPQDPGESSQDVLGSALEARVREATPDETSVVRARAKERQGGV